jgi:hypothetical protein
MKKCTVCEGDLFQQSMIPPYSSLFCSAACARFHKRMEELTTDILAIAEYYLPVEYNREMREIEERREITWELQNKIQEEYFKAQSHLAFQSLEEKIKFKEKIEQETLRRELLIASRIDPSKSCCKILKQHALILKDDPERLSTDFIKNLSKCECEEIEDEHH